MKLSPLIVFIIIIFLIVSLYFFFYPSNTYYSNPTYIYQDYPYPYYYDYDSNSRGWWGRKPWRQWGWGWPNYGHGYHYEDDNKTPGGWRSRFGENIPIRPRQMINPRNPYHTGPGPLHIMGSGVRNVGGRIGGGGRR